GVYVATGFAIAHWGSTSIPDSGLQLLTETMDPSQINAWLYENILNHARVRFPTRLFIRDLDGSVVEGGFLPVGPVWVALAAGLGGIEPALHVTGVFGVLALAFAMLTAEAASAAVEVNGGGAAPSPVEWGGGYVPHWPLVGAFLVLSFPQVWWAREP